MKNMNKNIWGEEYSAPTLELLTVAVEQGFAVSGDDGFDGNETVGGGEDDNWGEY